MMCRYISSPFSAFNHIYKLPPECCLEIDFETRTKTISKYWDLVEVKLHDITNEFAKLQLKVLISDSVKIRMVADVPLGTFLTRGIDSSLVVELASRLSENKIKAFMIGFDGTDYDENRTAEQFA